MEYTETKLYGSQERDFKWYQATVVDKLRARGDELVHSQGNLM